MKTFFSRRGFTLIELLVVIAIISILASILFPVFARSREKGRQAACLSNLRQIAMSFHMYSQDNDEELPAGRLGNDLWCDLIYPYTHNRQIFVCPSRKDTLMGYGVNNLMAGHPEGIAFDASTKIMVVDVPPEAIGSTGTTRGVEWWGNSISGLGMPTAAEVTPFGLGAVDRDNSFKHASQPERHNDGINVAYLDGHTKFARESQLEQAYFWIPALEPPDTGK